MPTQIQTLQAALREFAREREWQPFHTPKNLSIALMVEAGELAEHFQWLTDDQSRTLPDDTRSEVAHEVADVFLYLLQLSDHLGIDLVAAAEAKMTINAARYPADYTRGGIRKLPLG